MIIEVLNSLPKGAAEDVLVIGLVEGVSPEAQLKNLRVSSEDFDSDNFIKKIIGDLPNCLKFGEITVVHSYGMVKGVKAGKIILAGLGKKEKLTLEKIRQISASVARAAQKLKAATFIKALPGKEITGLENAFTVKAVTEGVIMGVYRFNYYKSAKKDDKENDKENNLAQIEKLIILQDGENLPELNAVAAEGKVIAESVNYARDLINHPAQYMTPSQMAHQAEEISEKYGLKMECLEKEEMQKLNMNALLAVAKGSLEPPKLVVLKYEGNPQSEEKIAFVGKGITFDSGGISLKPPSGMEKMIRDMSGAAAVLAAMRSIAQLKPKVNILGILPCTENMPSGSAYRPGDIITSMSGTTIEVISTDAEGRLILADALTYAKKLGATFIVDLATLTGACVVALGTITSGVVSNNKGWCAKVLKAAQAAGEKMWELPSDEEYSKQNKSKFADIKNTGGKPAGTITAGLFIGHFAGDTPWVHIDIAGTSDADKTEGYNLKGATGVGVRTLIELAKSYES